MRAIQHNDVSESPNDTDVVYRLDRHDRIVAIGGGWTVFAAENGGADLVPERMLGTDIYAHVSGEPTRAYLRSLFNQVRTLRRRRVLSIRCDSPDQRRFMEMGIEPDAAGGLTVTHRLVRVEPFERPMRFVDRKLRVGSGVLLRCSVCNRLKRDDAWSDPAGLGGERGLPADTETVVIHGVCPDCFGAAVRI